MHQATSYIFSFLFWTINDEIYIPNTTPKLCNNVNNVTSSDLQYHSSHDKNDTNVKEMKINSPKHLNFNLQGATCILYMCIYIFYIYLYM